MELEKRNAPLNIDAKTFRENGHFLIDRIATFLDTLSDRPVTRGEQPKEIKSFLGNDPLPSEGKSLDDIFQHAVNLLFEHSLHNGSPRFWGYITSSAAPAGILAELLSAAINANVGAYALSPMATEIERQAIRWMAEFIGYPPSCSGLFVSGGNMANITGILAARKAKATWPIREEGMNRHDMIMYCSKGTHTWIHKAADLLGFGLDNIRWIDVNEHQQLDVGVLEKQILLDKQSAHLPFVVVATAGSVGTGAIDPLEEIAVICKRHDLWLHIDGAYGAPAAVVPELASQFNGLDLADSIALDPHKWLYAPLEAGCILTKNPQALQDAFCFRPDYYNFDGKLEDPAINFHEFGFQNSRGFRALKTWIMLKQVGRNGYIDMIRDDVKLARTLFDLASSHPELEAISNHLSITTFRFIPNDLTPITNAHYLDQLNQEIVNRIQVGGEAFISNAFVQNKYCLRACIVNFRTERNDLELLVAIVVRTGKAIHHAKKKSLSY